MKSNDQFRELGYTEESLKMLESEEGQLNAVYAVYGSTAAEGQFLEDAIRRLVLRICKGTAPSEREGLNSLIKRLRNRITVDGDNEVFWNSLHLARKVRNEVIHKFFRNKKRKMGSADGRMEMLKELTLLSVPIQRAKELLNGMNVAFERACEGKKELDDEIIVSFSKSVQKSHLPPYPLNH